MTLKSLLIVIPCVLVSICLFAKKKGNIPFRIECKYGDVKPEDFAPTIYPIDSLAEAVYLFDGGSSKFEGNNQGGFSIIYSIHRRIRLLKKSAFDDLTSIKIPLI